MSALFVVLPLAVFVSALAVAAFLWAVRRGQLDDLDTPALRMLSDDVRGGHRPRDAPASIDRQHESRRNGGSKPTSAGSS